jgi:hypothetical protein
MFGLLPEDRSNSTVVLGNNEQYHESWQNQIAGLMEIRRWFSDQRILIYK